MPQARKVFACLFGALVLFCLMSLVASMARAQISPEVAKGLSWLQQQLQADGSLAGENQSIATPVQVRSEVALSLAGLLDAGAVPVPLRENLASGGNESTEHLARKVVALAAVSGDVSALVHELRIRQNLDGGFGAAVGLESTVLDTVWAYWALSRGSQLPASEAAKAFLLGKTESDGGLAGSNLTQRVQNSALGILALQYAGSDLSAVNGMHRWAQWLQSRQQADGSWAGSAYLTAVALHALSVQGADAAVRANARAYLLARQSQDGSWSADPFLTAVALRGIAIDPAATPAASSIAGVASDPLTGTPLAGVQVTLSGAADRTVQTGDDGRFSFAGLSAGTYTLQLVKAGFTTVDRSASLGYGQSLDLGSVAMSQISTAAFIKGRITAAVSGLPIAGASVVLSGGYGAATTTDLQGRYEFANVPAGSLAIAVSQDGFTAANATATVVAGQTLIFSPTLYGTDDPDVPTTGRLIGQLVSAGTGAPLANVSVELNGSVAAVTGADGRFEASLVPLSYVMQVAPSGFDAVTASFLMTAGAVVDAGTIALAPQRETTLISGRITDLATGQPIVGASIGLVDGAAVLSGSDGGFVLSDLKGTVFDIRVSASGYLTQTWQLQVERPSALNQDFAITPQPVSAIDLVNLSVTPQNVGAHTDVTLRASVVNGGDAAQEVVLVLQVLNEGGEVVALGSAFAADGSSLLGAFGLEAGEQREVLFKWNSGQFLPGTYRLVGKVLEAGTSTSDSPNGRTLATRSAPVTLEASPRFSGSVTANPPVLRANTGTTVQLSALVQNSGNVELPAQTYRLQVIDENGQVVLASSEAAAGALAPNQMAQLAFTNWVPTSGGNFRLEVLVPSAQEQGSLLGKIYVGDAASATYTVNKATVPAGDQTVRATLQVTGQDSATGTISDPLAEPIKAAIQKGVAYNDLRASNWALSNKCLGCHEVTQALLGGELTRRLTTYNTVQRNTLFNALSTFRQSSGAIYASHPEYQKTQTMLGLWALNGWRSKEDLAASFAAVADYVVGKQDGDGGWRADYATGWWDARPANTAFNLKSLTEVIETLERVPHPVARAHQVWKSGGGLNGTYHLEKTDANQVLVANYLAGTVMAVEPDGSARTLVSGLSNPQGLLQARDGNLYILTASDIRKRAPDGTTTTFASLGGANAIAMGADGLLYVAKYSNNTIYTVSPGGAVSVYLSGGPLKGPAGLAFDPAGNLVVTNYSGTSILRIKPDKSYETVVTWTNGNPRSVVPHSGGWLVGTTTGAYRYNAEWQGERLTFSPAHGLVVLADNTIVAGDGGTALAKLAPVTLDGASKITSYAAAIGRATTWLLNDANVNLSSNLELAHRLIGLGSAKRFYEGKAQAETLQAKMEQVAALLRSRQRSDGGWGRWTGWGSDSLVTAQVGFALDYLQPPATDPVVQNAIKFLLARQQADGSWRSENGILSTNLAATTWVVIWLPIALDRIGGIDADVTLRFAPNVSISNASLSPSVTTHESDGSVLHKWHLTGVTSSSRSIQFDLNLADMQVGEVRPVSQEAFLTFRNSFTDDSVDAPIEVPKVTASAFLGLGVSTDRTEYRANDSVEIAGQVVNQGVAPAGGAVEYAILASDGVRVATLGRVPFADVPTGTSVQVPISWGTGSTYAGQYLVEARLYDAENRYVATARSAFAILSSADGGGSTLTGTIRTDKSTYAPSEVVQVLDRITNQALNQNVSGLQADTRIANPDGSVRWMTSAPLAEIAAGGLKELSYAVPLVAAPAGIYEARMTVRDGSGAVVATDVTTFVVRSTAASGEGLTGRLQTSPQQVPLGEEAVLTFDVTNAGNDALLDLPLMVRLIDPVADQVVASFPYTASVAQSASFGASVNWMAVGAVGSTYVAVLTAEVGGSSLVLAQDKLTVVEAPVRLTLTPGVRQGARLLVLVSCRPGADAKGKAAEEDQACATTRAQWLDSFLTEQGIEHHVSTTVEDFTAQLHCGRYNTYWLSGGSHHLGSTVIKELREAVRRGSGLLIDGTHDERNALVDEIPGVLYRGKLPHSGYQVQLDAPVFEANRLPSQGIGLRFDLAGGTAQGGFVAQEGLPAVVGRAFGEGNALLYAFDLVGSLQSGGWNDVFRSGLEAVTPAEPAAYTGGAWVPLSLAVRNEATRETVVQVTAELPAGVRLDGVPSGATLDAAGNPTWQFTLAAGETRNIFFAVRAPQVSGRVSVPLRISTIRDGVTRLFDTVSADFTVRASDVTGSELVARIEALMPTTPPQRNARNRAADDVRAGLQQMAQGNHADATARLLSAADELSTITSVDVSDTSVQLARLIAETEVGQCNSLSRCTTPALEAVRSNPSGSADDMKGRDEAADPSFSGRAGQTACPAP